MSDHSAIFRTAVTACRDIKACIDKLIEAGPDDQEGEEDRLLLAIKLFKLAVLADLPKRY
jgi:hypothetical protein